MKVSKYYNVALITLIVVSIFSIAISVDARERGDREHPTRDVPTQPETNPNQDPENEPEEEEVSGPIIVPLALLERWEAMLSFGLFEEVEEEYRAFVEDGVNPTLEEDEPEESDEEDQEEEGDDQEPACSEVVDEASDRIRDRNVTRTRGETVTQEVMCDESASEDEEDSPASDDPEDTETSDDDEELEATYEEKVAAEIHRLTNLERVNEGLDILIHDGMLTYLATTHSEWMADTGIFSHERIDDGATEGCDLGCRLAEVVYPVTSWGENIAWRSGTLPGPETLAEAVMDGWMNSPSHRANVLSDDFSIIGVGIVQKGNIVFATQEFAKK